MALTVVLSMGANPWTTYSTQKVLNIMLGENANTYSTQQAANILLGRKDQYAERDSLVAHMVMIWEDNRAEVFDSSGIFTGVQQGIGVSPNAVINGDTNGTVMSITKLQALVKRGNWEVTSGGWDEPDSIGSSTGPLRTGKMESYSAWKQNVLGGFYGIRDTLDQYGYNFGAPRIHSWSQSSANYYTKRWVGTVFEFATQNANFADGLLQRPNTSWPAHSLTPSVGSGVAARELAALPGYAPDRYEILQSIGDTASEDQWKDSITRAVQTKGLVVFLGHNPVTANTTLGGGTALRDMMSWIDSIYVQPGLLIIAKPSDAFDAYYNRPISPSANWAHGNFPSYDTYDVSDDDPDPDEFTAGRTMLADISGTFTAYPDSVYSYAQQGNSVSGSVNYGHSGKGYATLDWAGIGDANNNFGSGSGQAVSQPWMTTNLMFYSYVPQGATSAKFEFWATVDASIHTFAAGDSMGVVPGTLMLQNNNNWGLAERVVQLNGTEDNGTAFVNFPDGATGTSGTATNRTPAFVFTAGDTLGGNWRHFQATVDIIPGFSDIFVVKFWKEGSFESGAVCISDYSLTYQSPGHMQAMSTQKRIID